MKTTNENTNQNDSENTKAKTNIKKIRLKQHTTKTKILLNITTNIGLPKTTT